MTTINRLSLALMTIFPTLALCEVSTWYPPDNPDPSAIRIEAIQDRQAGRYQHSLEKHVWYHENALTIDPAQYGVRVSFALMDWRQLANRYPPALEKMRETRDRAERLVRENKDNFTAFMDFVALNRELKDEGRTVSLFRWLDENDPEFAETAFEAARDTLIAEGEFELSGNYIGDTESFRASLQQHNDTEERMQQYGDSEKVEAAIQSLRRYLVYRMSNDIATLVTIGRSEQAIELGALALEEFGDDEFRPHIEMAINGEFPELANTFPGPAK